MTKLANLNSRVYLAASSVDAYFPAGIWYDFYKGEIAKDGSGLTMTLMDEGFINLHVRGGHILPLQKPNVTTFLSRQQDMGLFIAPDESGTAKGLLFWDDGISYETQEHKTYLLVDLTFKK
ncbi:Sucrase-isomaltase, intestinal, partial [Araneus ventricosus]